MTAEMLGVGSEMQSVIKLGKSSVLFLTLNEEGQQKLSNILKI